MAVKLGSLLIELGLDSAKFRSGTRSAERDMSRFQRTTTAGATAVKGALIGMVASLGVGTFTQAIREGLDYASSLGEVAQQLGVTTRTLQEYRYAGTQVGVTSAEMDAALARLTRTIGATPDKLTRLGIAVRDANGNMRDAGDILPDLAEALKGLESPAQRAAVLVDIFGRSGQKLAPLLAEGASGVNNLRDAAQRLGIVLSDEQIQKADETADKLAAVQTVLSARIAGTVADNSDEIVKLAEALGELADAALKLSSSGIDRWMRNQSFVGIGEEAGLEARRATGRFLRDNAERIFGSYGDSFGGLPRTSAPAPVRRATTAPPPRNRGPIEPAPGYLVPGRARPGYQRGGGPVRYFNDDLADMALNGPPAVESLRSLARESGVLTDSMRDLRSEAVAVIEELFPERRRARELDEDLTALSDAFDAGLISAQDFNAAKGRLLTGTYDEIAQQIVESGERIGDSIVNTARLTGESLQDIAGSVSNFARSIKSGGVFSIVESLIGLLNTIGGTQPGGLKIGPLTFGARPPGYALGTNFHPGGLAWVGERGRELVNLPRGSQVIPNNRLGTMGAQPIIINNSALADVYVDGRVLRAAPGISSAGAKGAMLASQRIGQRRLA